MGARVALLCLACAAPLLAQSPPVPFEDPGACPFELCTYGEWTARKAVVARRERRRTAPVAFRVAAGDKVTALTGVVVTVRAGRVQFRVPHEMGSLSGRLIVKPGQTLYLLTYEGEGFTKAWFDGRLYEGLDGSDFFDARCEDEPHACVGRIVEKPRREWWAQIRNAAGAVGWTDDSDSFTQSRP